jgi:catechol 2,3-dioxygenase-like lactoylglutathione lyase family enzyme
LKKISHVLVHSDSLRDSVDWYEKLLAQNAKPDVRFNALPRFEMEKGADLLIDDNRLCNSSRVFFESLKSDIRVNPIAIMETDDLNASLEKVRSRGAIISNGIESRMGVRFFIFNDPNGNEFMVISE